MFVEQVGNEAMVNLITAAYMAGKKVTVVDAVAGEIRLGAKMKPARVKEERSCKVNMEKPVKMKAETSAKVKTKKPAKVNAEEPAQTLNGPVLEASPPDLSQRSDQENRL